ncbi:hypothetical protein [Candidatus Kuenenia sp.]|uniref:hypothetical protein n=1 Tax=Candidatus Kuenenia sp. TaxID=2499824 RepID=UPI00321FA1F9
MVKEYITSAIKKVTLELIYQVVDERTEEIIAKIDDVKKRQEDDFRYLIQKIDTDVGQLRSEIKGEIGQLRSEIGQLRSEISQLNQRIDTVIQMLMNISQKQ